MRIHRLEVTGVGMFKERQVIDFDALAEGGLFCIDGPTGAGKSTLIDAIAYALFGTVFGATTERMRSRFCAEDDPTGVTCEFTAQGRRHMVRRIPKGVPGPDDSGRRSRSGPARQELCELAADGSTVHVLTRDQDIRSYLVDLLGMNADQFRRLVVLPQGQCAELLTMSPRERLDILGSLLGMDVFARLQEELREEGERAKIRRDEARQRVASALDQLAGRLHAYLPVAEEPPAPSSTMDEARRQEYEAVLADLAVRAADAEQQRRAAAADAERAGRRADAAEQLLAARRRVDTAEHDLNTARMALHPADADVDDASIATRQAELAVTEGSLLADAQWEADAGVRAADRARAVTALDLAQRAEAEAATLRSGLPALRADAEQRRAAALDAAAAGPAAAAEVARLTDLLAKAQQLARLRPELQSRAAALDAAEGAERAAAAARDEASAALRELHRTQRDQRAALLAADLRENQPCPVCGSADHPSPATPPTDHVAVTDETIEAADAAARAAEADLVAVRTRVNATRQRRHEAAAQEATLSGAVGRLTVDDLVRESDAAVSARDRAAAAAHAVTAIAEELTALAQQEQSLTARLTALTVDCTRQRGELQFNDRLNAQRAEQIAAVIGEASSATALLSDIRQRLTALHACAQAQHAVREATASVAPADRDTPVATAQARAIDARLAATNARTRWEALQEEAIALAAAVTQATPLQDACQLAFIEHAQVVDDTADAITLASLVTASSSANTRKLPLHSFAVQRRFHSVLAAASGHLARMSAGRFTFDLKEHSSHGHAGLGIAIDDSWTGQQQDPRDLSGGETFYASLALALGLAEAIQAEIAGSALETLFVDEGFGSLDQETLQRVLDQLHHLRAGGRAVGVISHVTEMRQEIPDRLEVRARPGLPSQVVQRSPE